MNFLFVITSLDLGGAQSFLLRLVQGLRAGDPSHRFSIVSLKPPGLGAERFRIFSDVAIHELGMKSQADYITRFSGMKKAIAELACRIDAQCVHGFLWHANRLVASSTFSCPRIINVRHWHRLRHWYDWSELQSSLRANGVTANNLLAVERLKNANHRTFYLPNIMPDPGDRINARPFSLSPFRWICPARILFREKKQALLLEAFRESLKSNTDQELTFAGDGPDAENLARLIDRGGLAERAFIVPSSKFHWTDIASHDACVLISSYEGFPNVLLEACAVRTPLLMSAGSIAGVSISDEEVAVVEDLSASGIARSMNDFIRRYPEQTEKIRRFGERASEFSTSSVAARFLDISISACGSRSRNV